MLKRIVKFNQQAMVIPMAIGYDIDMFSLVSEKEALEYINTYSKESFSWEFSDEKIIIQDDNVSVQGYPSVDKNYMIVIYEGENNQFPMPNNAVVYNLDGSIHRVLKIPNLLSPKILEKIEEEKHSNPPIEDTRYGHYGQGLQFAGFSWHKDEKGDLVNTISIKYAGEYGEWRIFNPKTGEFGKLTSDWYQSYGWR